MHPITIIGTGLAGYSLAREIRRADRNVALRLVTADAGYFYSKPLLSTALVGNKQAHELRSAGADAMAIQLDAEILVNTPVTAIEPSAKTLQAGDRTLCYRKLVLALGADPVRPVISGDAAGEILSVNHLDDYGRFRERLAGARRVVLLGGGLVGCELANDLAATGHEVRIFDIAPRPLGRLLPAGVADHFRRRFAAIGIQWHLASGLRAVERTEEGLLVTATDGSSVAADVVLSAVGLRPHVALAAAAGLATARGITVDRFLKTSAEDIYALGDCAEVNGQWLPFVQPIMQCVRALAQTLTHDLTPVAYPAMPVMVKTPACPTVVCSPAEASVDWVESLTESGARGLAVTAEGRLAGFALAGDATAEKLALTRRLGEPLESALSRI